jgi:hypothetical protein
MELGTAFGFGAGSTVFDQKTSGVADTIAVLHGSTTYYWRVESWNDAGGGGWSAVSNFGTALTAVLPAEKAAVATGFSVKGDRLSYSLGEPGAVEISFSDLLGRTALVVNRTLPAGNYSFSLNESSLAAGRYIVRFRAGGYDRKVPVMLTR